MLDNQKVIFNKAGIKFNPLRKQKYINNIFTRALLKNYSIIYFKCNKVGHKIFEYNIKRIGHTLIK